MIEFVMPCPEACEESVNVHGAAMIIKARPRDGSCWRCGGVGFIEHDGNSEFFRTALADPTERLR